MGYSLTDKGITSDGGPVKFNTSNVSTPAKVVLRGSGVALLSKKSITSKPSTGVGSSYWFYNSGSSSITFGGTYIYMSVSLDPEPTYMYSFIGANYYNKPFVEVLRGPGSVSIFVKGTLTLSPGSSVVAYRVS